MKRYHVLVLIGLWMLLYAPYILFGGLVRDDLGFLDTPRDFSSYGAFQAWMSSWLTMTARPVSALLHGLCYWFLGSSAWAYHLINLSLFLASVLFVYWAARNVLSPGIAFLTAALALVYPSASGTVFSSIMMNSNLAALFWSMAIYVDSTRAASEGSWWKDAFVTLLLLLSALSYEAFIPLFAANILVVFARQGGAGMTLRQALRLAAPVGIALLLFILYRALLEPLIFQTSFSRIKLPAAASVFAPVRALALGIKVAFIDSIRISLRSFAHLGMMAPLYLAVLVVSVSGLGVIIYRCIKASSVLDHKTFVVDALYSRLRRAGAERWPRLDVLLVAGSIFLFAHSIYMLSGYLPNARGFESRTQGGIRFAWAFLLAAGITSLYQLLGRDLWRRVWALGSIGLIALFALSIVVQREAWISAARYNDLLLQKMDGAIRSYGLSNQAAFTFVAELPESFPNQVNSEPTFGVSWDIGPALALLYPNSEIMANVYKPSATIIQPDGVTIDKSWKANYPFYLYRSANDRIYRIETGQDLQNALSAP